MYSNSRNDIPRVAKRYGTIAAHTRRRAPVLVVFVVFCVHVYSFAGLVRRTPPPTFSDTAITDRHSDITIFQLRANWVEYPGLLDRKNRSEPGRVAQSVRHLTRKSGVLGSIPGRATYFRFSFRFFKKGSCQLLAKVCARSTA